MESVGLSDVPARKLITIITPCYNEHDNIEECYRAVCALFEGPLAHYDHEHIFADNASTDGSPEILRRLAKSDARVKVILNARNFGPFRSTFNALLSASGDGVVVMLAADLQDPPELIVEFVKRWEAGHEVVYGIRANREEGAIMRGARRLYYRLVSRLADVNIPPDVGEFQLIDRQVVDALRRVDDYYPYIRGLIACCGFSATGVPYTWVARKRGFSKNRLYHLLDQALNGIVSFTNVPMRLCLLLGLGIAGVSLVSGLVHLALNLIYFRELAPRGIPTLIVAVFFFGGVNLFFIGILGEYLSAVHFQVRKRPMVVERLRLNFKD